MHYAPQILLYWTLWISLFASCVAKEPLDPDLLRNVTKPVESVLSSTLIGELRSAQSNRSAINAEQTVPRHHEQPKNNNDRSADVKFDNQVYPYHYERSYHYQYPPNPQDDPSRPIGYTEHFYGPRFRPKSHVTDSHDPAYYRAELYSPFGVSSNRNSQLNSNEQASSSANADTAVNGDVETTDGSGTSVPSDGPSPFSHPDILASPPHPFPSYRHGAFGRPPIGYNYFRPAGDPGERQKDPPGHFLPHGDERFSESLRPLPPLDPFPDYNGKEFQGYNEHRIPLPEGSAERSYPPPSSPFLGSIFPPSYQSPFHNGYRPSEHFNGLFSENFTRNFPLRPSFGGFYAHHNYLPPPPSSAPLPAPASSENKPEDPALPGEDPLSQPIPTDNPDNPSPVAAASNLHYELKLFFPARDGANRKSRSSRSGELTYVTENFRF